jgi:hypothetical protein
MILFKITEGVFFLFKRRELIKLVNANYDGRTSFLSQFSSFSPFPSVNVHPFQTQATYLCLAFLLNFSSF